MNNNRFKKFIPAKGFAKSLAGAVIEQKQECCIDCDFPIQDNFVLPSGQQGVPYSYEYALHGTSPFNFAVVNKPSWMSITLNGNIISFAGTPTESGNQPIAFTVSACGRNANFDGQLVVFAVAIGEVIEMVNFADEPTGDYPVGVFNIEQTLLGTAHNEDEFIALWNADSENASVGQLSITDNPFEFVFTPLNDAVSPAIYGLPYIEYPLLNFDNNVVPSAPYGLFSADESLLSVANNELDAVTTWNNESDFNDVAIAVPILGSDTSIGLFLKNSDPVPDMKALRYWTIDVLTGTPTLYLSPDTYVKRGDNVLVKSDTGTANVYNSFGMNANSYGIGGSIPLVDTNSDNFGVALAVGTNYIFHNETGEWAWCDVFGYFGHNEGNIPPTTKFLAIQSFPGDAVGYNMALSNFYNYKTALQNVTALSFNSVRLIYDGDWINYMPSIETFQLFGTGTGFLENKIEFADFNLSSATVPNLKWFAYRRNNSGIKIQSNSEFWQNLPPLTKGVDLYGAGLDGDAEVDDVFINLAISQAATVTEANARLTISTQNGTRTSASDAAVAVLEARPYSVV